MGTAQRHALPRERVLHVARETTFGTAAALTSANAVRVLSFDAGTPATNREDRADNRPTRSIEERITGQRPPIAWSLEMYLLPSGVAGTAPDAADFYFAAAGQETNVGGTSETYDLTDTQGDQGSLTIRDASSDVIAEKLVGVVVQELKIAGSGGDAPRVTVAGVAKDSIFTGRDQLDGALAGGESAITVDNGDRFEGDDTAGTGNGSLIDVGTSTGHRVTAIAGNVLTITPVIVGAQSDNDPVIPSVIAEVEAGSPVPGIQGSLTLDAVTVPILSYECTLNNQHNLHADEAFQQTMTDYDEGFRDVVGQLTVRIRADQLSLIGQRKSFGSHAVVITMGTAAGSIATLTLPAAEYEFAPFEKPETGSAVLTLPFKALSTGAAPGDEWSLAFT